MFCLLLFSLVSEIDNNVSDRGYDGVARGSCCSSMDLSMSFPEIEVVRLLHADGLPDIGGH